MSEELKKSWENIKVDTRWILVQFLIGWVFMLLPNTEEGKFWFVKILDCVHESQRGRND